MRTLFRFVPLLFVIMWANPSGFIHADPNQGNEPVLMQDGTTPQAVLMPSPDSVLMSDPTSGVLKDPEGLRQVAVHICFGCVVGPAKPKPYVALMDANCVLMADGTTKCPDHGIFLGSSADIAMRTLALTLLSRNADPTSGKALAMIFGPYTQAVAHLIWRKPVEVAWKLTMAKPVELALTCFLRNQRPERPIIVILRNPALAINVLYRSAVRA